MLESKKIAWWKTLSRNEKELVAKKCEAEYGVFQSFSNMMYHQTKIPATTRLVRVYRIIRKLKLKGSEKLIPYDFDPNMSKTWKDWPK